MADPEFYRSAPIDLLIADIMANIIMDGPHKGQFMSQSQSKLNLAGLFPVPH